MQNFRNLKVWSKAHRLTLDVYSASRMFPKEEIYGLISQMRRAAASIGANVAEGCREIWNSQDSCRSRWDRLVRSNITACWHEILSYSKAWNSSALPMKWLRSNVCWHR